MTNSKEDERWRDIARKMLKIENLPGGCPDISNPKEIMAVRAGYRNYAAYLRDVEGMKKMIENDPNLGK